MLLIETYNEYGLEIKLNKLKGNPQDLYTEYGNIWYTSKYIFLRVTITSNEKDCKDMKNKNISKKKQVASGL